MNLLDIILVFLLHNWLNPERFEQKRKEKKRGADLFFFINMASTFHLLERPQFSFVCGTGKQKNTFGDKNSPIDVCSESYHSITTKKYQQQKQ